MIEIKFAKVNENAVVPSKNIEDAGYDVYACFDEEYMEIKPLNTKMVPTGIASAVPSTHYFQIQERGSTGTKGIKYGAGVIDSGYRGEWFIPITNCNDRLLVISKNMELDFGDAIVYPYEKAIAQAILLEVPAATVKEISYEELQKIPSRRGEGSLGSSGK